VTLRLAGRLPLTPSTKRRAASAPRRRLKIVDGDHVERCQRLPCLARADRLNTAEKELACVEKNRERLLRAELRRVNGQCVQNLLKVEAQLECVKSECNKRAWHRHAPTRAERDELRAQVMVLTAQLAETTHRAETAEARVEELEIESESERQAYIKKAAELAKVRGERKEARAGLKVMTNVKELAEEQARRAAELRDKAECAAKRAAAAARAESEARAEEMQAVEEELAGARAATATALQSLRDASKAPPKEYSPEEFDGLSDVAQRQARFKERNFFKWLISGRQWRVSNIVGVMGELGWIEELWETKEFQGLFTHYLRELVRELEVVHHGTSFGLWLHLQKKVRRAQLPHCAPLPGAAATPIHPPSHPRARDSRCCGDPHPPSIAPSRARLASSAQLSLGHAHARRALSA